MEENILEVRRVSNATLFWAIVATYTIIISIAITQNKRIDRIEEMLREYFYKIDYHSLNLILKNSEISNENPPESGENNI